MTNLVDIVHIDVYGPLCVAVCGGLIFPSHYRFLGGYMSMSI